VGVGEGERHTALGDESRIGVGGDGVLGSGVLQIVEEGKVVRNLMSGKWW
jgi:hypothetical protein